MVVLVVVVVVIITENIRKNRRKNQCYSEQFCTKYGVTHTLECSYSTRSDTWTLSLTYGSASEALHMAL